MKSVKCKVQSVRLARVDRISLVAALLVLACGAGFSVPAASDSDGTLGTTGAGRMEVSVGDLVTDAMRAAVSADFAFISASELKEKTTQIGPGKVTTADITPYIAYPDDTIVTVQLTGKQMKQALERSVLIYPQPSPCFLQVSGLRFVAESGKPKNSRVKSILAADSGKPITDDQTYSVAMAGSLASGALGYWKIWTKDTIKQPARPVTTPQAIEAYLASHARINYSTPSRITIGG